MRKPTYLWESTRKQDDIKPDEEGVIVFECDDKDEEQLDTSLQKGGHSIFQHINI